MVESADAGAGETHSYTIGAYHPLLESMAYKMVGRSIHHKMKRLSIPEDQRGRGISPSATTRPRIGYIVHPHYDSQFRT